MISGKLTYIDGFTGKPLPINTRDDNFLNPENDAQYVHPPQHPVSAVPPLNSVPYTDPPLIPDDTRFPAKESQNDEPAMVFLPSRPAEKDTNTFSCSIGGVVFTGSAALGKVGPDIGIGLIDIGESEDGYIFRISLPGVETSKNQFSHEVEPSGKIVIKGVTTTGEGIVLRHSQIFDMQSENLSPTEEFSATFTLPGPVDCQTFSISSFVNGMLVGQIKKKAGWVI